MQPPGLLKSKLEQAWSNTLPTYQITRDEDKFIKKMTRRDKNHLVIEMQELSRVRVSRVK